MEKRVPPEPRLLSLGLAVSPWKTELLPCWPRLLGSSGGKVRALGGFFIPQLQGISFRHHSMEPLLLPLLRKEIRAQGIVVRERHSVGAPCRQQLCAPAPKCGWPGPWAGGESRRLGGRSGEGAGPRARPLSAGPGRRLPGQSPREAAAATGPRASAHARDGSGRGDAGRGRAGGPWGRGSPRGRPSEGAAVGAAQPRARLCREAGDDCGPCVPAGRGRASATRTRARPPLGAPAPPRPSGRRLRGTPASLPVPPPPPRACPRAAATAV